MANSPMSIIRKYGLLRTVGSIGGRLISFRDVKANMPLCWVEHGRLICMEISSVSNDDGPLICRGTEVIIENPFKQPELDPHSYRERERRFIPDFFNEIDLENLKRSNNIGYFFKPSAIMLIPPTKLEMLKILKERR